MEQNGIITFDNLFITHTFLIADALIFPRGHISLHLQVWGYQSLWWALSLPPFLPLLSPVCVCVREHACASVCVCLWCGVVCFLYFWK